MEINRLSPEWLAIRRYAREEIVRLQGELEKVQSEAQTNHLRGEIASLRRLLASVDPTPVIEEAEDTKDYV